MAAVTACNDFGAQENKICHCFLFSPIYLSWSDGTEYHDLSILNVEFKPAFSLSSFTFIKRLFNSSSLSPIRVVWSAYLWLLIFLLAILIPACTSSSPASHMMYSAYKLNKQGDSIQTWHTPFPIWNQSIVSPSICHDLMVLYAMIFVFWMLSLSQLFHSPLSPSSRGLMRN